MRPEKTIRNIEAQMKSLYISLYQTCISMSLTHLEEVCRRIHTLEIKIRSFRGGLYDGF